MFFLSLSFLAALFSNDLNSVLAFSPLPIFDYQNGRHCSGKLFISETAIPTIAPLDAPAKNIRIKFAHDVQEDCATLERTNRLELDDDGRLRLDQKTTLLDNLSREVWTGEPVYDTNEKGSSSLFLHATHSEELAEHELALGNLVSCRRLLACSRLTRYWMGPAFGTSAADLPLDTQFLLVELSQDGPYALFLPLVDAGFRASLEYKDTKMEVPGAEAIVPLKIVCYSESGDARMTSASMRALYVSVGDNPYALLREGFQQVADTTGSFCTLQDKELPKFVDDFGWCTWDAFYSKVHPRGILKGVKSLREAGVPPRNVIVDDGWQQVSPRPREWDDDTSTQTPARSDFVFALTDFVSSVVAGMATDFYEHHVRRSPHGSFPNKAWTLLSKTVLKDGLEAYFNTATDFGRQLDGFEPNFKFQEPTRNGSDSMAMGDLVTELKKGLGVKRVYCWHALHGYWRGVTSGLGRSIGINVTQVYTHPSDHLLRVEPQMAFDTPSLFGVGMMTSEPDLDDFYQHLHEPLVKAGVDGVKVDVQSGVSAAGSGVGGGPHIARLYTESMEKSVSRHFASEDSDAVECINCMAHSTENLYRYKRTSIARASDDFYPSRWESHTVHLINVAYNSLFLGEICLPDYDMFQSRHESAPLHAAARAVGGCPVYVSDVPDSHDTELLSKLVLPDGSILRAEKHGRPTRDILFSDVGRDKTSALKIWNTNKGGGGVVGAFNVQGVAWNFKTKENEVVDSIPAPVTVEMRPSDVDPFRHLSGSFVVWWHTTQSLEVVPTGSASRNVTLNHRDWEIATFVPIAKRNGICWAPIGLRKMMNTGGAIVYAGSLETTKLKQTTVKFAARGPGEFACFCRPAPTSIMLGGLTGPSSLAFTFDDENGLLSFDLPAEHFEGAAHNLTVNWAEAPYM